MGRCVDIKLILLVPSFEEDVKFVLSFQNCSFEYRSILAVGYAGSTWHFVSLPYSVLYLHCCPQILWDWRKTISMRIRWMSMGCVYSENREYNRVSLFCSSPRKVMKCVQEDSYHGILGVVSSKAEIFQLASVSFSD